MNPWTEFDVGLVYYGAIFMAVIAGIFSIRYVGHLPTIFSRILDKGASLWSRTFMTTLILAAMLGAMSVSLKDCDGNYNDYVDRPEATLQLGLEQLSDTTFFLAATAGIWFLTLVAVSLGNRLSWELRPIHRILIGLILVLFFLCCYEMVTEGISDALLN